MIIVGLGKANHDCSISVSIDEEIVKYAKYERDVNIKHKNAPEFDHKAILRTSFETAKKLKQIRNLMNLTSWAKYFDYEDINELRKKIILELVYTEKTLEEIKRELQ